MRPSPQSSCRTCPSPQEDPAVLVFPTSSVTRCERSRRPSAAQGGAGSISGGARKVCAWVGTPKATQHSLLRDEVSPPPPGEQLTVSVLTMSFGLSRESQYFRGPKSAPAVLNDFSKWPSRGVQKHTCVEGPLAVRGGAMGLRGTVGNVQHRGYRPLTAANGREALPDKVRVASGTRRRLRRLRRLRSPLPHPAAGDEAGFLHLLRRQAVPANRVQKPTRESHRLLCSCQLERGLQKGRECCSCH